MPFHRTMRTLEETLDRVDSSVDDMVRTMIEMTRIPALAPFNGGDGEGRKADYLETQLRGFDTVERVDVPDWHDPSVMRANILARKKGPSKGTVWVVAHMDVVPTGDPDLWDTPPFDPVYRDGKVYGRGTEDNGQSVISSIFASRACMDQELHGMSMGVALVADEETSSKAGIEYLLDHGYFSEDDVIYVPDYVLSRSREIPNQGIGSVRQLNSASDMTRYYITRNRGYLARYFQVYGDYRPVGFAVGTLLTFAKEFARILMVDRGSVVSGTKRLFAGWREQRRIQKDPSWEPMPPLA